MKAVLVRISMPVIGLLLALVPLELIFRLMPTQRPRVNLLAERPAYYYLPAASPTMQGNNPNQKKSTGEYRIAVIGDSFSFAPGMQYLDAYPKKLEGILAHSSNVSVFNFGTPGFGTEQELRTFSEALTYSPDLILLQITLNDPQLRPLQLEPDEVKGSFGPYQPKSWLARHSKFVAWVGARIHNTRSVSSYIAYHEHLWSDNWERFYAPFEQMRAQAEAAHVGFGVVLFPLFDFPLTQSEYPFSGIHKKIKESVTGKGVAFLDLFSAYEGLDPYRLQLTPGRDSHPNEIAHRIAAERIYWWLRRQPFFPAERKLRRIYPKRNNIKEMQFARSRSRSTNATPVVQAPNPSSLNARSTPLPTHR